MRSGQLYLDLATAGSTPLREEGGTTAAGKGLVSEESGYLDGTGGGQ